MRVCAKSHVTDFQLKSMKDGPTKQECEANFDSIIHERDEN